MALSEERIEQASLQIAQTVAGLKLFEEAPVLFLYAALPFEVQTHYLHQLAVLKNKKIAYPKTDISSRTMTFYEVADLKELLLTPCGKQLLYEPDPNYHQEIRPGKKDLAIVPGLAFDQNKNRLGYGAGFYDRWLAAYPIQTIGLAFACQLYDKLPTEAWDKTLNGIVTEESKII